MSLKSELTPVTDNGDDIMKHILYLQGLKDQALAEPDKDETLKWEKGVIRGKVFVPKVEEVITKEYDSDDEEPVKVESTSLNYDDEYG